MEINKYNENSAPSADVVREMIVKFGELLAFWMQQNNFDEDFVSDELILEKVHEIATPLSINVDFDDALIFELRKYIKIKMSCRMKPDRKGETENEFLSTTLTPTRIGFKGSDTAGSSRSNVHWTEMKSFSDVIHQHRCSNEYFANNMCHVVPPPINCCSQRMPFNGHGGYNLNFSPTIQSFPEPLITCHCNIPSCSIQQKRDNTCLNCKKCQIERCRGKMNCYKSHCSSNCSDDDSDKENNAKNIITCKRQTQQKFEGRRRHESEYHSGEEEEYLVKEMVKARGYSKRNSHSPGDSSYYTEDENRDLPELENDSRTDGRELEVYDKNLETEYDEETYLDSTICSENLNSAQNDELDETLIAYARSEENILLSYESVEGEKVSLRYNTNYEVLNKKLRTNEDPECSNLAKVASESNILESETVENSILQQSKKMCGSLPPLRNQKYLSGSLPVIPQKDDPEEDDVKRLKVSKKNMVLNENYMSFEELDKDTKTKKLELEQNSLRNRNKEPTENYMSFQDCDTPPSAASQCSKCNKENIENPQERKPDTPRPVVTNQAVDKMMRYRNNPNTYMSFEDILESPETESDDDILYNSPPMVRSRAHKKHNKALALRLSKNGSGKIGKYTSAKSKYSLFKKCLKNVGSFAESFKKASFEENVQQSDGNLKKNNVDSNSDEAVNVSIDCPNCNTHVRKSVPSGKLRKSLKSTPSIKRSGDDLAEAEKAKAKKIKTYPLQSIGSSICGIDELLKQIL